MSSRLRIGRHELGAEPWIVAEAGLNHLGSVETALALVEAAAKAGAHAVKFQKRSPEHCVPEAQRSRPVQSPWGTLSYLDYRRRMELPDAAYAEIGRVAVRCGIDWFVSVWDEASLSSMQAYAPAAIKLPSAALTDLRLLRAALAVPLPLVLSTGMSSMAEIRAALALCAQREVALAHATSIYPCPPEALNLRMLQTLQQAFPQHQVGYSGHEADLAPSFAAVALGARFVERHFTLDRSAFGRDQQASLDPEAFAVLVQGIRSVYASLGDGVKRVYAAEREPAQRLQRVPGAAQAG